MLNGEPHCLEVNHVIICAGQEPLRVLHTAREDAGASAHLVGGAEPQLPTHKFNGSLAS